jgi:peptidoglycan/LPS O-acetylase OafA/YrhL
MYLYHPTLLIFVRMAFDRLHLDYLGSFWINMFLSVLALFITILFSQLSYEFFEKKILRYKSKFSFVATRV